MYISPRERSYKPTRCFSLLFDCVFTDNTLKPIFVFSLFQEVLKHLQGSIEEETTDSSEQIHLLERLKSKLLSPSQTNCRLM